MRVTKRFQIVLGLFLSLVFTTGANAAGPNTLAPQEIAEGWVLLFDGETLFGWQPASKAEWKVADGVISAAEGEPGLLCTTSPFADYVLKVDFRCGPATNSGIFLRTPTSPSKADLADKCYELNIGDTAITKFPTGSLVQRKRTEAYHASADWQTFEVTAEGAHFLVKLDGKTVLDYTDPKPVRRGLIGLQFNSGKIEFRNVKLRPLGLTSIFNGKDLTGWKTDPGSKTIASVTPGGWLRIQNGRGQLETDGRYGDFVLQLDGFVNGKLLNSGVFYRSIPGELMNGYESQIHNGFKDGDRTKPMDCGTGGIFRRQNARRVVANDKEWFIKTILAADNHMSAWVNGYQVTDWTDTRPPDANPRKGLRTEPGTIILQGHDPTTDFFFRNLRVAELPSP